MANESFTEALHRLKDIHDKEVLGMQAKLTELTMEKCRDSQRIEELFSKNHILREQHKVLNENIKVLENRLRAGLCDRCTVTQELAKKKQQEYESCHFHNLQQISSLNNEINLLKEENKTLLDELRKVKCVEMNSRSHSPENNVPAEAQQPGLSTANQKNCIEKTNKDRETPEMIPERQVPEETCAVLRLSPPVKHLQGLDNEARQADMNMSGVQKLFLSTHNQQRISNQLHGTIAVMRSGAKSGAHVPPAVPKRSPNHELHSKELPVETCAPPFPLEPLKHVLSEEQFTFLKQHYVQKHLAQRGPGLQSDAAAHILSDKHRETPLERRRSEDNWEEKVAMAELQGAVLYVREQGLKNKISQATQREKLHYLLTKQSQGLRIANSRGDAPKCLRRESQEDKEMSLIQVLSAHWRNSKQMNSQDGAQDWEEKETKCAAAEARAEEQDPDKPLDLSDTRGSQNTYRNDIKKEQRHSYEGHTPSPPSRNNASPPIRASCSDRIHGTGLEDTTCVAKGGYEQDAEEDTKDKVIDFNLVSQADRESSTTKRLTKGHKRHRDSDEDEEQIRDINSPQDMYEESDASDSKEEMERSEQTHADGLRDNYANERNQDKARWKKRLSQVSKKSLRKNKKVRDRSVESDTSEESDQNQELCL